MCFPFDAIDHFGRTAGLGPRDEDFEYMPHVQQSRPEQVARDVAAAAIAALDAERVITVGFCFGGAQSFMQAAEGHDRLAGVVGFYGSLKCEGQRWALDRAPEAKVPVLGLFAGDDQNITADQVAAFDAALPVSTRSSPTRAHRTRSSIAAKRRTRANPRTRGSASWDSCLSFR